MIATVSLQADLRFLLPLQRNQNVGLSGTTRGLASVFSKDGIRPIVVLADSERGALLLQEESLDHIFLPRIHKGQEMRIREFSAALRPGGWLLLGFKNSRSLHRTMSWKHSRRDESHLLQMNVQDCKDMLAKHCLEIVDILGVDANLDRPEYLIPLTESHICRFYFRKMYLPRSPAGKVIRACAPILSLFRLQSLLFRDVAIIARKPYEAKANVA